MIKRIFYILCLLGLLGAEVKETYNLDDLIAGADAFGRGGAYLAAENNSNYIFQNYSLLGKKEAPRITLTAFKLISEINYLAAAYSQGNWGLGIMNIGDTGGYVRDERNRVIGGQIGYSNIIVYGAYGRQLSDEFFAGARLKYHSISFSASGGSFDDTSASGTALDVATLYHANDIWNLSGEINNLFSTPLRWSTGFEEIQPMAVRLGTQFKVFGPRSIFPRFDQPVNLYADVRLEKIDAFWSGGLEYWPSEHLALRTGLKQTANAPSSTYAYTTYTRFTAGVGFNWYNVFIDYAFNPGDDLADNITHFFTLSYRFNTPPQPEPEPEPEFTLEVETIRTPPPVPSRNRMFVDLDKLPMAEQALIEDLGYIGVVQGYPGYIYGPELPMTRRELMMVLVRLLEHQKRGPEAVTLSFPDIAPRDIITATKAMGYGLLYGYPDGNAYLENPVREDEAAYAFARYYQLTRQNMPQEIHKSKEHLSRRDAAKILGRIPYVKSFRTNIQPLDGFTEEQWQDLLDFDDIRNLF